MKTLYLECKMGVAGDMLMAALFELMNENEQAIFIEKMNNLGLSDVTITPKSVTSYGIAGTHMEVLIQGIEEDFYNREAHSHSVHTHDHNHEPEHEHNHDGHTPEHHHGDNTHDRNHGDHTHEHTHSYDEYMHNHDHSHESKTHSHGHESHSHTSMSHIEAAIERANLSDKVKENAKNVYLRIADAESRAHGVPMDHVHFHEVGSLDAVVDVTGVALAMDILKPDRVICSPIHIGSGTVRCAHGVMPVPTPATANLLRGIPTYSKDIVGELCTPTGAALVAYYADSFGEIPLMSTDKIGYGMGTRDFGRTSCVRAFIGEAANTPAYSTETTSKGIVIGEILELVCNIDDMTPEALSYACARLIDLGALDAYTTAGTMKKGRPGFILTVLCNSDQEEQLAEAILRETTTNGLRVHHCKKYYLRPSTKEVETRYGKARVKLATSDTIRHIKPEYDDVIALASAHNETFENISREIIHTYIKEK